MTQQTSSSTRTSLLGRPGGLAVFAALSAGAAAGGAIVGKPKNRLWYRLVRKSELTPPDATFGVVWPVLYGLGAWSAWRVARTPSSPARTAALALWGAQLACNAAWTPVFFGAHRPRLALGVLVANAALLGAYALVASRVDGKAAAAVVPNLAWLGFAGVLNTAVVTKNAHGPTKLLARG